jgi:hypothetical protein
VSRLDAALAEVDPAYRVQQVKQKRAGLRYYWEPSPDLPAGERQRVEGPGAELVRRVVEEAAGTCEWCGATPAAVRNGTTWGGGWRTLCDDCAKKRDR